MQTNLPETQLLTLAGQRYVLVPEAEYRELAGAKWEPPLPTPDASGNYPASQTARVLLARKIIRRRRAIGLTQAALADLAGVRVETLCRLEHARHAPTLATLEKIIRALEQTEAQHAARARSARPRAKRRKR